MCDFSRLHRYAMGSEGRRSRKVTNSTQHSAQVAINKALISKLAEAVSRQPVTAEARVHSQASRAGFVVNKVALGRVYLPALRSPPASMIPPMLHHRRFVIS